MVCVCSLQTRSQIFYNKAKYPTYILQESVLYGKQGSLELTKFIYLFIWEIDWKVNFLNTFQQQDWIRSRRNLFLLGVISMW